MIGRNPEFVTFGPFRFVPGDGLWRHGQPVALPPRALAVLTALLTSAGTVVSKQDLMDAAWPGTFVTKSSLLEAIGLLREALGDDRRQPTYIQTVHRRGYRFIAQLGNPRPEFPPFFSGPEWRPIVVAGVAYALTTICVAIVFAIFGQERVDLESRRVSPRFAISHAGALVYLADSREVETPAWTPSGLEIAFAVNGAWPSWSNDGATVYFTAGGNTMASAIRTESGLAFAAPAIAQPGSTGAHGRADLRIVLDWFSELASHVRPS